MSVDGRSIGIALYTGSVCHFSDRRIHVHGETQKPIEVLFRDVLYGFKHSQQRPFDEICIILETPWITEVQSHVTEKRQTSFEVSQNIINNLIYKDAHSARDTTTYTHSMPYIIEQIALNGYIYPDPYGKITNQIEVAITKFAADQSMLAFIEKSVTEFWNKTPITFKAGPVFIFTISKKLKAETDMYISLGSTDTVIRLYSRGIVSEKINVPFGFQNILESLGSKWNTSSPETTHWIELFLDKTLNDAETNRIKEDIRTAVLPYIESFTKAGGNKATFLLERPITLFGAEKTWNRLFKHLLKERYFGELFPNIDATPVIDIASKLKDLQGDRLIATYARENELA